MPRVKKEPVEFPNQAIPETKTLVRVPSTPYLVDLESGILYLSPEFLGELQKLHKRG